MPNETEQLTRQRGSLRGSNLWRFQMEKPKAESFKLLTISVEKLPASMAQQTRISEYATERARLLLGCYRTGDANDPATYVAAIAATLARYSEQNSAPAWLRTRRHRWQDRSRHRFDSSRGAGGPSRSRIPISGFAGPSKLAIFRRRSSAA